MKNQVLVLSALTMLSAGSLKAQLNVGSTSVPNSTLQVTGSSSGAFTVFSSGGTVSLDQTMHYVLSNVSPSTQTKFVLPDPSTCTGREYIIKSYGNDSVTVSGGSLINSTDQGNVANYGLASAGAATMFIAGNSTWQQMGFVAKQPFTSFLYLRANANTNITGGAGIQPVDLSTALYNTGDFTFNAATNVITVNKAGTYIMTFQTSWIGIAANQQLTGGIADVVSGQWICRGTHWASTARSSSTTVGEILYVTGPVILTAGQTVQFAVASSTGNPIILATEAGASGSGIITNASLQKFSN